LGNQTYDTTIIPVSDFTLPNNRAEDVIAEKMEQAFRMAAELLRAGEVVAFPTETVYGLGADATNDVAVRKIFQAKGRPSDNPLIVHIADESQLTDLVRDVPEVARRCMEAFWPGPLTLVMKCTETVSKSVTAGLDTVGVRMPNHPVALRMIREAGLPIAAPSANRSGRPSPTTAQHVWEDLNGKIPLILDGGTTQVGLESTVLDVTVSPPLILRPGDITLDMLRQVIGDVRMDPGLVEAAKQPKSPGMKYTHYAPKGNMTVFQGDPQPVRDAIFTYCKNRLADNPDSRIGVLLSSRQLGDEDWKASLYRLGVQKVLDSESGVAFETARDEERLKRFGALLYAHLREFDADGIDTIYAEGVKPEGLGIAILNRMRKAAGNQVIDVNP
jgi:L-threonylcarbamoyladenylate synthase